MSNGRLAPADGGAAFAGQINTLQLQLRIVLRANPRYRSGNNDSPKYEVFAKTSAGEVQIGRAWERAIDRGERAGEKMLSLTLDDPSFDKPLNLAAFPNADGGFDVAWRRPRQRPDGDSFQPDRTGEDTGAS